MARILVSNTANAGLGAIIAIVSDDHVFTPRENFLSLVASGEDPNTWKRLFVTVNVTDKSVSELEMLNEKIIEGDVTVGKRYSLRSPDPADEGYQELMTTGEFTTDWQGLTKYILDGLDGN